MKGTLYLVATPIGNLDDISKRALETLASVDLVLAEDTRVAGKLLTHYGIRRDLVSYHQHSGDDKKLEILNHLLNGKNIALVTDAGTPGISDPGNELVDFVHSQTSSSKFLEAPGGAARISAGDDLLAQGQTSIVPIPGPSAASAAMSVCGFDMSKHIFLGFWPKKKVKKLIDAFKYIKMPFVYFDSPFRVVKNLEIISENLGKENRVFVGRELTKMHETHYRGTLAEVIDKLKGEKFLKGEIVVVIE